MDNVNMFIAIFYQMSSPVQTLLFLYLSPFSMALLQKNSASLLKVAMVERRHTLL